MDYFSTIKWKYDVFLSFRGEDTRASFTDHLYEALKRKGIYTFRDEEGIRDGMDISSDLWMAIEVSRIAIAVLSKNYASSTWCLEELVKIFQCKEEFGLNVVPIFYDVDPSDVRKQRGSFAEAFMKHEARFGVDDLKVKRWRQVLSQVANLKGWTSQNWSHETEMIEEISEAIWKKIQPTLTVIEEGGLIGISSKLKLLARLLNHSDSDHDVVLVGIHGMGGIGKTTLARVIYQQILKDFEVHCFLSDVKDKFQTFGLPFLQTKLLSRLGPYKEIGIWDAQEGLTMIARAIFLKKVLLVIDDVDQLDQMNGLIPKQELFGYGSRIIITTRNADLLLTFGIERRFKMEKLEDNEALQLFSLNAFMKAYPKEGFLDPSNCIVKLLRGHPLALKVLGASLRNKDLVLWHSTIEELREGVNHDQIFKCLKISYDGLDEKEKEIFLDIACFFKGKNRDCVVEILDGCGFFATTRVELLVQKSLISISNTNKLHMHDLLQEMGRQIVRQKPIQNRLWTLKHIKNKVKEEAIQSILLKLTRKNVDIPISFTRMPELRLLSFKDVRLQNQSEYCIPSKLRYLQWKGYPLELLSLNTEEYELIQLHMCYSNLKQFWKGSRKYLEKLKYIKLNHSQKLVKTPDFSEIPNLEKLNLEGCIGLFSIHPSIFTAKKLIHLNLKDCKNLTDLPSHIQIEVLSILILSGCSKIKKIPEFLGNTEKLLKLYLDGTCIRKLPSSFGNLIGLTLLSLKKCNNLVSIPSSIQKLKSLQSLDISECSKLGDYQPKKFDEDECKEELDVRGTARSRRKSSEEGYSVIVERFKGLFCKSSLSGVLKIPSLYGLSSLIKLDLKDCNLRVIPEGIDFLCSLTELQLSGNTFSHLPETISRLENLQFLGLRRCKKLLCFPAQLPSSLVHLHSAECVSLKNIPEISKVDNILNEINVDLINCYKLDDNQELHKFLTLWMQEMSCSGIKFNIIIPGSEIPDWFTATSMGSSITMKLDSYILNVNSTSLALCVIFGQTNDIAFINHNSSSEIRVEAYYRFSDDEEQAKKNHFLASFGWGVSIKFDHIWTYVLFKGAWAEMLNHRETEFQFLVKSNQSNLKVKKCGLRLFHLPHSL